MAEFELPDGWLTQVTVDCFEQVSTNNSSVKTKDCLATGQFPVIDQGQAFIAGYTNDSSKVLKLDSPIVVFGDHTRVVKWVDFDFVPGADGTKLLRPQNYLYPRFFYHQFNSLEIPDKGYARHFKHLRELQFLVPPLAEQKVIAEKLDTLLAQVDNTKARLERIPDILKRFRQSVLAAAVSGKLTEEWRDCSSYDVKGFPVTWQSFSFNQVGQLARGKSKHRPRNDPRLFGTEYPFIQTGEVANSRGWITQASKFYSKFGLLQSHLFEKGTLCITIAANIADTAILGIDACFPDSIVAFSPDKSKCNVLFVKYLIDVNKSNLEAFAPATAQKNINLKVLNELIFPFPLLEEQAEIVRRVEELFAFADRVEHAAQSALSRVNNLTQSILAKAFRGELTAEWRAANPELISGEHSAEELLARIKAERAKVKPKKTIK